MLLLNEEMSIPEPVGLLNLPDELLHQIVNLSHGRELYSLSLLCRRLHNLALPTFLARRGISIHDVSSSGKLVLFGERLELLPFLQMALFITSLGHLHYTFRSLELAFDIVILRDIRRLDDFLSNLRSLEAVTLDFTNVNWYLWSSNQGHIGWSSHLGFLLNTLMAKSCKTLTLLRGTPVDHAQRRTSYGSVGQLVTEHEAQPCSSVVRPLAVLKKAAGAVGWGKHERFSSDQPIGQSVLDDQRTIRLSQGARLKSELTTFILHSPLFLVYPCYSWTIEVLTYSPITCLSIGCMGLTSDIWSSILPLIDVPSLSDLSIESCTIATPDLLLFLTRHPQITRLLLDRSLRGMPSRMVPVEGFLPRLTTLAADPIGLQIFFSIAFGSYNALSIRILTRIACGHRFDPHRLTQSLTPLIPLLGDTDLYLRISVESGSTDWLFADVPNNAAIENLRPLQAVTQLDFVSEFVYATYPPTWLGLFPLLEQISFTRCTEMSIDVATFVDIIRVACPAIKAVIINGRVAEIP